MVILKYFFSLIEGWSHVVALGVASCIVFYASYFGNLVPAWLLLGTVVLFIISIINKTAEVQLLFRYLALATLISFFALLRITQYNSPPITLGDLSKATSITFELNSEPRLSGSYYKAEASLRSMGCGGRAEFSARGNIIVFFPREVVDQTLSGGISLAKAPSQQSGTEAKIFVRGVVMETEARYAAKKEGQGNSLATFFTEKTTPRFVEWTSPLARVRGVWRFTIMRLLYGWGAAGALLLALVSADKSFLSQSVYSAFVDAGLAHVLALSGMHVSLVNKASESVSGLIPSKLFARAASLIAMAVFVWFAGTSPSLNRALGMAFILTIGKILGLPIGIFSALSTMFILHILALPNEALTLSFALSYGALAGILVFGEALNTILEGKLPPIFASSFSASFGAQAFTIPIIAFTIKRITLIGLISSTIISPLIGYFLLFGFMAIAGSLVIPSIAPIFGAILNYAYQIIIYLVRLFEGIFVFDISNKTTALAYSIISIMLGFVCIYCQKNIQRRRFRFAQFTV